MKRILSIVLSICMIVSVSVSVSVLSPKKAFACSCGEPSVEERFEHSSIVFTGTLVSKDRDGGNIFSLAKVWKGNFEDGYVYSGFFGMCGTEFEVGKTYLVYTENLKGKESTGLCSGNKLISEASKDIQALDRLTEPSWKNNYLLILLFLFVFAAAFSIIIWRAKSRFKK
ncbi:hypothetical protein [Paenibacillus contaminans]|uniref:Cobalamin biosynthesis protein CbiN n=1 Tax=Paenibacillus contaminans TaxID=450362 RepID=A0A329LU42_9BACL|nr:hypothetical protein [Paenibacillus contaminans]RAV10113.1 hypothetical protein DQG23_38345 [Paenibacillus contaminans]